VRSALLIAAVAAVASVEIPAGYTLVVDSTRDDASKAVYTPSGTNWDVRTGPHHILFAAKDTSSGVYAATATIEQLESPGHREAFGIFIGGKDLTDPTKRTYMYFVVAGTGEYIVKVMRGSTATTISDWKGSPDIPKADASGKASYKMYVHVAPNAIHFMVNGKLIAEIPKAGNPTDGIAGLRINHNLHLMVTPLTITK
jgi:hypothetical protein